MSVKPPAQPATPCCRRKDALRLEGRKYWSRVKFACIKVSLCRYFKITAWPSIAYFLPPGGGGNCTLELAANSSNVLGILWVRTTYRLSSRESCWRIAWVSSPGAMVTAGGALVGKSVPRGDGTASPTPRASTAGGTGSLFLQPAAKPAASKRHKPTLLICLQNTNAKIPCHVIKRKDRLTAAGRETRSGSACP